MVIYRGNTYPNGCYYSHLLRLYRAGVDVWT